MPRDQPSNFGMQATMKGLSREGPRCLGTLSGEETRELADAIRTRTGELVESDESWRANVPSRVHLEWAASILALHEALLERGIMEDDALAIVARITRAGARMRMRGIFRVLARLMKNTNTMSPRRLIPFFMPHYAAPWRWRISESSDGVRALEIGACFYHEFMTIHGRPELTAVICALHNDWLGHDEDALKGMRTLAHGENGCHLPIVDRGDT